MLRTLALTLYLRAVCLRARALTDPRDADRGDGPVPTSIIIAGLALLAAAVVAWATTKATDAMKSAP